MGGAVSSSVPSPREAFSAVQVLDWHQKAVRHIVSLSAETFVTAGDDGWVCFWSPSTGRQLFQQRISSSAAVTAVHQLTAPPPWAVPPGAASQSNDPYADFVSTSSQHQQQPQQQQQQSPSLIPALVIGCDNGIVAFLSEQGDVICQVLVHSHVRAIAPTRELGVAVALKDRRILFLGCGPSDMGRELGSIRLKGDPTRLASYVRQSLLVIGTKDGNLHYLDTRSVVSPPLRLDSLPVHGGAVTSLDLRDDHVLSGGADGCAVLHRGQTFFGRMPLGRSDVRVAHTPVGPVATTGGRLVLFDAQVRALLADTPQAHQGEITALAVCATGLLTGGRDARVRTWLAGTSEPAAKAPLARWRSLLPFGRPAADPMPLRARCTGELAVHDQPVLAVAPVGEHAVAAAYEDGLVVLWTNARTLQAAAYHEAECAAAALAQLQATEEARHDAQAALSAYRTAVPAAGESVGSGSSYSLVGAATAAAAAVAAGPGGGGGATASPAISPRAYGSPVEDTLRTAERKVISPVPKVQAFLPLPALQYYRQRREDDTGPDGDPTEVELEERLAGDDFELDG